MKRRIASPATVLAVCSLAMAMAFIDATIVNIAFPDIERSFPASDISTLSWVLNAYNIVFAAFLVAFGRLADLIGRRRILLAGIVLFVLASTLCALAPSVEALIGFRALQALGAAMLVPSSLALVLQAFPPERRPHAVALFAALGALAAGVGPSLGGLLVSADNWRLVFLVNLPVGIAAFALARRQLVESREPGRRTVPDLPGAAVLAVAIAAFVLGVVQGEDWGWDGLRTVACFAVAIALLALFVWRSSWHRSPIIALGLCRRRTFAIANSMSIVAAAGFYGYTLVNVLFLIGVWRYPVLAAGLAISPGPFVAVAVAGPASRLAERIGHRPVLVAGGLVWAAAVYWFVRRVGPTPDYLGEWLPGMLFLGVGAGMLFPNLSAAAVASAPGEGFATATGLNSVARQVGAALGVAIVVAIIDSGNPLDPAAAFDHAWTFAASCLAAAGLGCLFVGRVGSEDDISRSPSLGDSARSVIATTVARPPAAVAEAPASAPAPRATTLAPRPDSVVDFLAAVSIFAHLTRGTQETIAARARPLELAAGQWLFHAGEEANALFVVRAGRLEVVDEQGGRVLRVLGRGAALGELALLTSLPRSASVRAARDTDLIVIGRAAFELLLREEPGVALALTRELATTLRESGGMSTQSRVPPQTIALVPLGADLRLGDFPHLLRESLGAWGRVDLLGVGGDVPAAGGDRTAYGPLLDAAIAANDRVLLLTAAPSDRPDPWTSFCLQQADRILAVVDRAPREPLPDLNRHPELRGCDLVSLQLGEGSGPPGPWATLLDPIETHAVRRRSARGDTDRIARRLSGNSIGIVLSGGGARAFSHLGVLEELTAAGIVIDRVGGVSMGAYIGAMFATEMGLEEIDARCYEEWVRRRPLADYTLPRHSLIRGERARQMLDRTFGSATIEELGRGYFSGATELRSGELVIIRSGPLWEAVAFSFCLPVLAPVQIRGRELLVDGALVDNMPVETMAELGEGPVIAVDVKATFERPAASQNGGDDHHGPPMHLPSVGETLARVLFLNSADTADAGRRYADWTITPHGNGVGLFEFHQLDQAREAGRAAARAALEQAPEGILATYPRAPTSP